MYATGMYIHIWGVLRVILSFWHTFRRIVTYSVGKHSIRSSVQVFLGPQRRTGRCEAHVFCCVVNLNDYFKALLGFCRHISLIVGNNSPISISSEDLLKKVRQRIRTQYRIGGERMRFIPTILSEISRRYEQNFPSRKNQPSFYNIWLDSCVDNSYFETLSGKSIRLKDVSKIELVRTTIPCIVSSDNQGIYLKKNKVNSLGELQGLDKNAYIPNMKDQFKVYVFYNTENGNFREIANVGGARNTVSGIDDLSLDHVVSLKKVFEENEQRFPMLKAINLLIRLKDDSKTANKYCSILGNLNFSNKEEYEQLKNEMNLLLTLCKGIVFRSGSFNSSKG